VYSMTPYIVPVLSYTTTSIVTPSPLRPSLDLYVPLVYAAHPRLVIHHYHTQPLSQHTGLRSVDKFIDANIVDTQHTLHQARTKNQFVFTSTTILNRSATTAIHDQFVATSALTIVVQYNLSSAPSLFGIHSTWGSTMVQRADTTLRNFTNPATYNHHRPSKPYANTSANTK
jgi:hypothetical protein